MTEQGPIHIADGPGKFDLMVSLFEGNRVPRTRVAFKVDNDNLGNGTTQSVLEVAITMVAQEDGSGEAWLFEGYVHSGKRGKIHGFYSSQTRTGWYSRGAKYMV